LAQALGLLLGVKLEQRTLGVANTVLPLLSLPASAAMLLALRVVSGVRARLRCDRDDKFTDDGGPDVA